MSTRRTSQEGEDLAVANGIAMMPKPTTRLDLRVNLIAEELSAGDTIRVGNEHVTVATVQPWEGTDVVTVVTTDGEVYIFRADHEFLVPRTVTL